MRSLTDHQAAPNGNQLDVHAADSPGSGGANHRYLIRRSPTPTNHAPVVLCDIRFQDGPIGEAGVNGVTGESLLAVVADRLRSFQSGPYACGSNARALEYIESALQELHSRTLERHNRGAEGTSAL